MADKRFSIVFDAKMEIGSIKGALDQINRLIDNTSLNLPKGVQGSLTKTIQGIKSELLKLEGLQGIQPNAKNAAAITKSYDSIFTKFQSLQALMKDLGKDIAIDPKKFFPDEVIGKIKQATVALDEYHKKLKEGPQTEHYRQKNTELNAAKRQEEAANKRYSKAKVEHNEAVALTKTYQDLAEAKKKAFDESSAKSKKADAEVKNIEQQIKAKQALVDLSKKEVELERQKKVVNATKEGSKARVVEENKAQALQAEINELREYANAAQATGESLEQLKAKAVAAKEAAAIAAQDAAAKEREYQNALKDQSTNQTNIERLKTAYETAGQTAQEAAAKVQQLNNEIKAVEQTHADTAFQKLIEALSKIEGIDTSKIKSIEDVNTVLSNLNTSALDKIQQAFAEAGVNAKSLGVDLEKLKGNVSGFKEVSASAQRAADDMSMLQSRLNYFFSSLNMINLFKRTVRQAINTVKELDAVMTETAVVTNFTVGDMWDKLPQYAEQANALGASIKDLYSATTLYYQQGLQTNAAMGVGVETMKMARIANMEAAEATQAMTAALRGFNMEVNEMNAQVVNDVYSELAAITAADTSQIATAMTKTASIASSANMEFETTAALLAQIIETTQEAPETAGTAMKTIIARFTEVKKLFSEGMLTGEDEEGEAININKIDAALKTVGISLKDFLTGSKGIDDIFLELASKWDTLDLATQRYIATTAAGSRQQSRFIAMMSDYERTMELVDAAQNSSGASQEQFNKTLDSMEAKLQKLKNAWNEFVMGLANNDILKAGVDILTGLLNAINGLTSVLSGGGGITKSLLSILTVVGALKGGKALLGGIGIIPQTGKNIQGNKQFAMPKPSNAQITTEATKTATIYGNTFQGVMQKTGQKVGGWLGKTFTEETQIMTKNAYEEIDKLAERKLVMESKSKTGQVLMRSYKQGDLTKDQAADLKNIYNEYRSGAKTMEQADEAAKKYGVTMRQIEGSVNATSFKMQKFGVTVMGVGAAFSLLGSLAKELELDGLSEALSKVGSVMVSVGSTAMMLAPALKNMGVEFTNLGVAINGVVKVSAGALGIFAILLAAVVGFAIFLKKNSIDAKLEKATENLETSQKEVNNLTDRYNELNDTLDSISEKQNMLDNYIAGTQAWKDKVVELNQEMANLVTKYPQLGEFLQIKDGILSFDQQKMSGITGKTLQETVDTYSQYIDSTTRNSYMNEIKRNDLRTREQLNSVLFGYRANEGITTDEGDTKDQTVNEVFVAAEQAFKAIGEGTLFFEDGQDKIEQNYKSLYEFMLAQGLSEANADSFARYYAEQERSALVNIGQNLITKDAQNRAANMLLINDNILKAGLSETNQQIMQSMDYTLLAKGYEKFYANAEDTVASNTAERNKAFTRATGYEFVSGNKFVVEGKDEEFNKTYIEGQAATQLADEAFQAALVSLSNKLSNLEDYQTENLSKLLSEGGKNIDRATLDNYFAWAADTANAEKTALDYFKQTTGLKNLTTEELQALGFDTEEDLANQIKNNLARGLQNYVNSKKDLVKIIKKFDKSEKDIWKAIEGIDDQKEEVLTSVATTLEQFGDSDLYDTAMSNLFDNLKEISTEDLKEIGSLVDSINWNNPIEAVEKLSQAANSANKEVANFANSLLSINSAKIGLSAQFKQVINSDDFAELNEEMAELIETNGQIDSSNINEWREDCGLLNKMMKQTGITAEGMAKALTMLQKEELKLSQMTNAVLAAFTAFDGVGDVVYNTVKSLEDFDPGLDEGAAADFIGSQAEILSEHIEAGEWGNTQSRNIIEFLFGSDALKDGGQYLEGVEYAQAQKDYLKFMKENSKNMSEAWYDLASGEFLGENLGLTKATQGTGVQLAEGLELLKHSNGNVELKGYENYTVPEIIDTLTKYTGSEQLANMMFTDLANVSPNLQNYKATWDYEQGMAAVRDNMLTANADIIGYEKSWFTGVGETTSDKGIYRPDYGTIIGKNQYETEQAVGAEIGVIDQSELEALAKIYGKDNLDEIKTSLGEEGVDYKVTDFYDDEGKLKSNEELYKNIEDTFGTDQQNWLDLYTKTVKNTNTGLIEKAQVDYDELLSGLEDIGLPESARQSLALDMAKSLSEGATEGVEFMYETAFGTEVPIHIDANTTEKELQQAFNNAELTAEASIMGEAFASALTDFGIEIEPEEIQSAIIAAAEGTIVTVGAQLDSNTQSTIQAALNNMSFTAKVGISLGFGGHAKGIKNSPNSHLALTGEEGPELVQTATGYYITGQNGPEMAYINKGDTVYTANQTKKILKTTNPNMGPRYGDGILGYGDIFNSNSGSGGRSTSDDEGYKTSIDKLYNLLRDIDEELRIREALERRYTKILEGLNTTAKALVDVSFQELDQLKKERGLNEERIAGRQQQIQQYQQENSKYNKYAWSETDEHGNMVLRVDWAAINAIDDEETGKGVEEYLGQLEDWFGDIEEAEDNIIDIDEAVKEINERGKDEYFDFENQVKEALIDQYQEEIDKLSDINDSINDTNSRLLDAVQKSIDQQRQDRENAKTEEDLADKRAQLAYLQQDTSGANALDILKLQEEIAQGEEDYTDTLIDQKINELQQQNDEAAQQRERQIEIAQEQLDHWVKTGEVWNAVYGLLATGIDDDGIISGSDLEELLKDSANFKGMSELEKVDWLETLEDTAAQALHWLEVGNQLENLDMKDKKIDFITADGTKLSGIIDKDGNITADGKTYKNIYRNYDGTYVTREEYEKIEPKKEEVQSSIPPATPTTTPTTTTNKNGGSGERGDTGNTKTGPYYEKELRPDGYYETKYYMQNGKRVDSKTYLISSSVAGSSGGKESAVTSQQSNNKDNVREIARWTQKNGKYIETWVRYSDGSRKCIGKQLAFATGGLADFTGPAWLDGTKSRPEYVLNADQTRAFFTLVDVLEALRIGTSKTTENSGDINYDIDINVESIGSDYDVEQMAGTIKRLINDDARYRNNNAINLMR